jgi:hypothetical protein
VEIRRARCRGSDDHAGSSVKLGEDLKRSSPHLRDMGMHSAQMSIPSGHCCFGQIPPPLGASVNAHHTSNVKKPTSKQLAINSNNAHHSAARLILCGAEICTIVSIRMLTRVSNYHELWRCTCGSLQKKIERCGSLH